jgi:hypothetical protein
MEYSKRLHQVTEATAARALHIKNHILQSRLTFGLKQKDAVESCLQISTVFTENQNEVQDFMHEWKET